MLKFDLPKNQSSIIKVIGVGGGGSNAITHMFHQGIKGVDFILCNTDAQVMESNPIPTKIQLGANLTGGLGAGGVPSVGKNAALESIEDIRSILEKGTKMLFITAGLGGGTGTGAAPVIASISKELGILTVAIVTIPFSFEGRKRIQNAEQGIAELKKHVDALLIICNDKLRDFGDQKLSAAFAHADDILTTAAKGIAEIITVAGYINVDFEDVKTVMKDSGVAIMGNGIAGGEDRAVKAVEQALNSPLLNNNDIDGASNILLYISSGKEEITMDEVSEITDYIQVKTNNSAEVIWGNGFDESLDDKISVTIIATGFDEEHKSRNINVERIRNVTPLYVSEKEKIDDKPPTVKNVKEPPGEKKNAQTEITLFAEKNGNESIPKEEEQIPQRIHIFDIAVPAEQDLSMAIPEIPVDVTQVIPAETLTDRSTTDITEEFQPVQPLAMVVSEEPNPEQERRVSDRIQKLKALSEKLKNHVPIENNLYEIENVPAYKRRNVELSDIPHSSESQAFQCSVTQNPDNSVEIKTENSFLHKIVD